MAKRKRELIPGDSRKEGSRLNELGQEVLNNDPVTLPVRYQRGENITDRVQRMVEETISRRAAAMEIETVDEANDFDIDDDPVPQSVHEIDENAEYDYSEERRLRRTADPRWFKRKEEATGKGDTKDTGKPAPADKPPQGSGEGA